MFGFVIHAVCERIAVTHVWVFDAVQEHVHAADAQHGVVKVEAVEHVLVKVLFLFGIKEHVRLVFAQVLAGGD
jgi:hypothetical protein